jgi:hypothetical protein
MWKETVVAYLRSTMVFLSSSQTNSGMVEFIRGFESSGWGGHCELRWSATTAVSVNAALCPKTLIITVP